MSLRVHSSAFAEGTPIPRRHTGDGEDLSPQLSWSGLPATARELALIVDDPDAPTKEPWVHWVIYNLARHRASLPKGSHRSPTRRLRPEWSRARTPGIRWGIRAAPPKGHGIHRYYFKLYALDTSLQLPEGLDKAGLLKKMEGHIVTQAVLMGTYHR